MLAVTTLAYYDATKPNIFTMPVTLRPVREFLQGGKHSSLFVVSIGAKEKSFKISSLDIFCYKETSSGLYYKSFTIIIYDHNDSMIIDPLL